MTGREPSSPELPRVPYTALKTTNRARWVAPRASAITREEPAIAGSLSRRGSRKRATADFRAPRPAGPTVSRYTVSSPLGSRAPSITDTVEGPPTPNGVEARLRIAHPTIPADELARGVRTPTAARPHGDVDRAPTGATVILTLVAIAAFVWTLLVMTTAP